MIFASICIPMYADAADKAGQTTNDEHWAFVPPQRPALPTVGPKGLARNAIDHFILTRLDREGLEASPEANRPTLIRRLSLDLTGLPPAPEEVAAFLADNTPDAYEKVVDRLLNSPAYGERMALNWLDGARYADTHGYHEDYHRDMWPWRDWVIKAFNANMPFDQFTIEQLAGDLVPGAGNSQRVASAFNRNHGITASGIAEEYRMEYALDRVRTTSTVWMGLTIGCAQCHDHKYDPVSQKEFYQFLAYFNSITDKGIENLAGNVDPLIKVVSTEHEAAVADIEGKIKRVTMNRTEHASDIGPALAEWEKQTLQKKETPVESPGGLIAHLPLDEMDGKKVADLAPPGRSGTVQGNAKWRTGRLGGALALDGKTYVDLGGSISFERTDAFSYGAWIHPTAGGAVISRMDDSADYRGWDLYVVGDKVEVHIIHRWPDNALHLLSKESIPYNQWTHLFVTYDGSSKAAGIQLYFDGNLQIVDRTHDSLTESIKTEKPLHLARRNPSSIIQGAIDDVRIYNRALKAAEVAVVATDNSLLQLLAIEKKDRTRQQQRSIRQHYLANHDTRYQELTRELAEFNKKMEELQKAQPTVMVMQEMAKLRQTFVLKRGLYDQPGEAVGPGIPDFLPAPSGGIPGDRLALAKWLVDPAHPLTARVAVNRLWQMIFGTGIVESSEDFGTQGQPPSHPALLDWLATEYTRLGWDTKALLRLIVTSATYRQSSKSSNSLTIRDPANRLLARGPRFRLPAEAIRDSALFVSGLLVQRLGGPSVKPYQPPGLWRETSNRPYKQDRGEKLYRRSLYTYWKRSVPPPNMFAIDAPTRETCTVRRQRTNTPLMALVLLNDVTFVEAARALAQRAMTEAEDSPRNRARFAFRLATARECKAGELDVILNMYHQQRSIFLDKPELAKQLVEVGESPRNQELDVVEHAAWTAVANAILNLDESITKQ